MGAVLEGIGSRLYEHKGCKEVQIIGVCQEKIRGNAGVCFKYLRGLFGAQWEQVWSMLSLV